MFYSMTAFARAQNSHAEIQVICEVRSINHRFLEIGVNLPEQLRHLEMGIRDAIRRTIQRGKIDCHFKVRHVNLQTLNINLELALQISSATEAIGKLLQNPGLISPADILKFPNVIEMKDLDASLLKQEALATLTNALNELMQARAREGEELKKLFYARLEQIKNQLQIVKEKVPSIVEEQKHRIAKRFNDVKLELDPVRLEQEVVIYSQRVDVTEEIERAETHIQEFLRILSAEGPVGRRLDFLLQELNREANTICSKSVDPTITHAGVEMKVLIEQIREQVQNIE